MKWIVVIGCFLGGYYLISKLIDSMRAAADRSARSTAAGTRPARADPGRPAGGAGVSPQIALDLLAALARMASPAGTPDPERWAIAIAAAKELLGVDTAPTEGALRAAMDRGGGFEEILSRLRASWLADTVARGRLLAHLQRIAAAGAGAAEPSAARMMQAATRILT